MSKPLPPYSGGAQCPKCGNPVSTVWHPMPEFSDRKAPCCEFVIACWPEDFKGEHLCRVCERCGYGWMEATADASPGLHAVAGDGS